MTVQNTVSFIKLSVLWFNRAQVLRGITCDCYSELRAQFRHGLQTTNEQLKKPLPAEGRLGEQDFARGERRVISCWRSTEANQHVHGKDAMHQ